MNSRNTYLYTIIFTCLLPLTSVQADVPAHRLGVCISLSGAGAKWAEAHLSGMRMAADDFKEQGTPVELLVEDTKSQTAGSVSCFQRLMAKNPRPGAVIGDIFGFLTTPMMSLAKDRKIPLISSSVSRLACPKDNPYFFTVSEQVQDLQPTFEKFFKSKSAIKKISIIAFDDPEWGRVNREAVKGAAAINNVEVLEVIDSSDLQFDFRGVAPRIVAKNPDAVFIFNEPLSSTRAFKEINYKGIIVQSNAVGEQLWDTGKAPEIFEGVYFADIDLPPTFQDKFKAKFKHEAVLEPQSGYDAVAVAIKALKKNVKDPATSLRQDKFVGVGEHEIDFSGSCAGKKSQWSMFEIKDGVKVRA